MFYYVLLFKYAAQWHFDCFVREECYDKDSETDRLWLAEATRAAVKRLNLRKENHHHVEDAILHEMVLRESGNGESATVGFATPPADARKSIPLTQDE